MKKLLLIISLITLFTNSYSQETIRSGEIILRDSSKLQGFIKYKNWNINPEKISFSESSKSEFKSYGLGDIIGFSVVDEEINEKYELFQVSIDTSGQDLNNQPSQIRAPEAKTIDIFLQTIYSGRITLYLAKINPLREQFFIKAPGEKPVELLNKKHVNDNSVVLENQTYKNQLFTLLGDCDRLDQAFFERLTYSEEELVKTLRKYETCKGITTETVLVKKDYKNKVTWSVNINYVYSPLRINSDSPLYSGFELEETGHPGFGGGLEFFINRTNRKYSLGLEVGAKKYAITGLRTVHNVTWTETSAIKLNLNYLQAETYARRYFGTNKMKSFLQIGLTNAFLANSKNTQTKTRSSDNSQQYSPFFGSLRKYEQGYRLTAGMLYEKLEFRFFYGATNGFSPYNSTKTTMGNTGIQLNFRFR